MKDDSVNSVTFSQEIYKWLKEQDISDKNRLRLSRIFKAAGPGQVKSAYKLATCLEDKKSLETILWGILAVKMNLEDARIVLQNNNLFVPDAESKFVFLRIIEGALEILHPGSYRFSKEEYRKIKDGLKKRME